MFATRPLHLTDSTPEPPSLTVPETVTEGMYTVVPVFPVVGDDREMMGGVRSMLNVTEAAASFVAKSVAVPLTA